MARVSTVLEMCPRCRVVFIAPQRLRNEGIVRPGKTCPRGHWTHVATLRAHRPPVDAVCGEIVPATVSDAPPSVGRKPPTYRELRAGLVAMLGSYNHVMQTLPSSLGRAMVQGAFEGAALLADQMLGDD